VVETSRAATGVQVTLEAYAKLPLGVCGGTSRPAEDRREAQTRQRPTMPPPAGGGADEARIAGMASTAPARPISDVEQASVSAGHGEGRGHQAPLWRPGWRASGERQAGERQNEGGAERILIQPRKAEHAQPAAAQQRGLFPAVSRASEGGFGGKCSGHRVKAHGHAKARLTG
jgi:hypothetical protein